MSAAAGVSVLDLVALVRAGLLQERAVADVRHVVGSAGRIVEVRLGDALTVDVLPDRGLDIGNVRVHGVPLSWVSPVADGRPLDMPVDGAWIERFTGGLLATCGLRNIGPATPADSDSSSRFGSRPEGMHGDVGHLPATDVHAVTSFGDASVSATVTGRIDSVRIFGDSFRVDRTITCTVDADAARVAVADRVTNVGVAPARLSQLFHINLGAPFIVPGSRVRIDAGSSALREPCHAVPSWQELPQPAGRTTEAVFEHRDVSSVDDVARASIESPAGQVEVTWSASTLPRLYQWVLPTRTRWALGIEPSTAPLFGDDRLPDAGGAPLVEPGETREQKVAVTVRAQSR